MKKIKDWFTLGEWTTTKSLVIMIPLYLIVLGVMILLAKLPIFTALLGTLMISGSGFGIFKLVKKRKDILKENKLTNGILIAFLSIVTILGVVVLFL